MQAITESQLEKADLVLARLAEFCEVRNLGTASRNGLQPTPRLAWICSLLQELGISYELESFYISELSVGHNLLIWPSGDTWISAHHDIVNPASQNANDNSASVLCAIATRILNPAIGVVLTDAEEVGGLGALNWAELHRDSVRWCLCLELSGVGGESFFIGEQGSAGPLGQAILREAAPPIVRVPFNDSHAMRRAGVDSCCVNPARRLPNGDLDLSTLAMCHRLGDRVELLSQADQLAWSRLLAQLTALC